MVYLEGAARLRASLSVREREHRSLLVEKLCKVLALFPLPFQIH